MGLKIKLLSSLFDIVKLLSSLADTGFPKWGQLVGDTLGKMAKNCMKMTKSAFLGQSSGGDIGGTGQRKPCDIVSEFLRLDVSENWRSITLFWRKFVG